MGFIQTARLAQGKYATLELYIPKTLPITAHAKTFDFQNIIDFSGKWETVNCRSQDGCWADPKNPPERMVQFLGQVENGKTSRKVGYAYGYSLTEGITRPEIRRQNCNNAFFLYSSSKSYPHAIDSKMGIIPKGTEFECVAYRQYFAPNAVSAKATDVYWHKQGKATILYADYHQTVDGDQIKLPRALRGKRVSVIEKTASVNLVSGDRVPAAGLKISVKDNYGYLVLKLD